MNPLNPALIGAVLWDMDGVLVDTGEYHYTAWQQTLFEYKVPFSREQFRATFGINNLSLLTLLFGEPPSPALYHEINNRKESNFRAAVSGRASLLPGVKTWLEQFARHGIPQAVASSAPQENIDLLITELGIRSYFQSVLSASEIPGKPDPAVFLLSAQRLGVLPETCLVIEDSIAGVEAARRAGMRCLAVTTTNPAEKLQGAHLVVERLDQLACESLVNILTI
jgi:HAD superfamily hydrolase (TIGR01509 family)